MQADGTAFTTCDLFNADRTLQSCSLQFRDLGGRARFSGTVRTIRCHRDNGLVKQLLNSPGNGAVLVVDGAGSLESALMGDLIAGAAVRNGWAGVVINGAIRDRAVVRTLELGVKALGTNPRTSAKDGAGEVDVTVEFGGAAFTPGARLWADEDGILVTPAA
ncbi:ribonuclease E activity regulator RraA [Micrococcus sp. TA1]|uniref:ribonuclease E activity regulator RraA n=1 Tax=Micrococcus sp. TA1 TaxID=681627 RepID=UPI00161836B5|nr:ribonuclease E activity regulator RraA [Micrococcus sp. TA1]MBB5747797.1 regulator of ribonuclease activity A [Micrococcus sp. TA1]